MRKVIRLTESELISLVKRVIKEDEDGAFGFGDKVRDKLGSFIGITPHTDHEKRLADDILDAVMRDDFRALDMTDSFWGRGFTIIVNLGGEDYKVSPRKETVNLEGGSNYITRITAPDGQKVVIGAKGFTKKLIDLISKSDNSPRFKYPRNK